MKERLRGAAQRWLVRVVALGTLGSGLFDLYSLVKPSAHLHTRLLLEVFPIEFIHLSRFLTLFLGFSLAVSSINLLRRKRRAWQMVMILSVISVALHSTKGIARGIDLEHVFFGLLVLILLLLTRKTFTVGSGVPRWRTEGPGLIVGFLMAVLYGVAGFWFLDRRDFGINFTVWDSLHRTLRFLSLVADPQVVPQTRHARWFVDSLYVMSLLLLGYVVVSLFRPVYYQFRIHPRDAAAARAIVERHGRTAVDYFKLWPDKSYIFSSTQRSFIAYRVGGSFAVALGDPVGPEEELEPLVGRFLEFCHENDWGASLYQDEARNLSLYRSLGLKKLKIGDEAIVELEAFNLDGKDKKGLRHKVNQLEKAGLQTRLCPAPIADDLLVA